MVGNTPGPRIGFFATQRLRIAGLRDLPARTALRVTNTRPLRRLLAARYAAAQERFRHRSTPPCGTDAIIVAALERDGVYVTSLAALMLPGSDPMLRTARVMAEEFAEEAHRRVRAGSDFNVVPATTVVSRPEVFVWGLDDRLLDIAEAYLGLSVAYDGVSINYTVADGREVSTRKWHRDWEDRRMLKIAVYLNDVDAVGGPFQMIARSTSNQCDAEGYRYMLASDAELTTLLGTDFADAIVSCEGPAGTVVFTDTARFFHRGQPTATVDRKAVFYSYFASPPRHPFLCERSGLSRRDIARLAFGLPTRQRAAALWRRKIPAMLRLIPPARI